MSPTRERIDTGVWDARAKARFVVCAASATLLLASVASVVLPQVGWHSTKHGVGGWIAARLPQGARACVLYDWPERVVVRNASGFVDLGEPFDGIGGQALADSAAGGNNAWHIRLRESRWPEGTWAATSTCSKATLQVVLWSNATQIRPEGPVTSDELSQIRIAALNVIEARRPLEWPASKSNLVVHGTWKLQDPFPIGFLINAATLAGLAMFACTVRGVVRDVKRHTRAVKFLREHCCGWCGYDVRGLAEGATVCPECGKAFREATPG